MNRSVVSGAGQPVEPGAAAREHLDDPGAPETALPAFGGAARHAGDAAERLAHEGVFIIDRAAGLVQAAAAAHVAPTAGCGVVFAEIAQDPLLAASLRIAHLNHRPQLLAVAAILFFERLAVFDAQEQMALCGLRLEMPQRLIGEQHMRLLPRLAPFIRLGAEPLHHPRVVHAAVPVGDTREVERRADDAEPRGLVLLLIPERLEDVRA